MKFFVRLILFIFHQLSPVPSSISFVNKFGQQTQNFRPFVLFLFNIIIIFNASTFPTAYAHAQSHRWCLLIHYILKHCCLGCASRVERVRVCRCLSTIAPFTPKHSAHSRSHLRDHNTISVAFFEAHGEQPAFPILTKKKTRLNLDNIRKRIRERRIKLVKIWQCTFLFRHDQFVGSLMSFSNQKQTFNPKSNSNLYNRSNVVLLSFVYTICSHTHPSLFGISIFFVYV